LDVPENHHQSTNSLSTIANILVRHVVALACCFGKLEANGNADYYIDSLLASWHNLYLLQKAQETFAVHQKI
jgi:hypothetical protein